MVSRLRKLAPFYTLGLILSVALVPFGSSAESMAAKEEESAVSAHAADSTISIDPARLSALAEVDQRFQSYNIEMLEITGGQFWKPYRHSPCPSSKSETHAATSASDTSAGMYEHRSPIDLGNVRLRKLAAALGLSYVRVSGTWANSTYFYDSDGPAPATPPDGFKGVLTRKEWKAVVDFTKAVDGEIVTSVTTSPGTRSADGVWTADQTRSFLAYTNSIGGKIAAAEFMNEPKSI